VICYSLFETPWGIFGYVAEEDRLLATYLPRKVQEIRKSVRRRWPEARERADALPAFRREVENYYAGTRVSFSTEIDLTGAPGFRRRVLQACRRVIYGMTASYADLAGEAGNPRAARAVGGAMAHNPLPLVVPCHRILRSDGSIGGFSTPKGISEKRRMLELEACVLARNQPATECA